MKIWWEYVFPTSLHVENKYVSFLNSFSLSIAGLSTAIFQLQPPSLNEGEGIVTHKNIISSQLEIGKSVYVI